MNRNEWANGIDGRPWIQFRGGRWQCRGQGWIGVGKTVALAYQDWRRLMIHGDGTLEGGISA